MFSFPRSQCLIIAITPYESNTMLLEAQRVLPANTWEWKSACLQLLRSYMASGDKARLLGFQRSSKMFLTSVCLCLFSADPERDVFVHFPERRSGHTPPSASNHKLVPPRQTFISTQLSSLSSDEGRSQSWLLQSSYTRSSTVHIQ